MEIRGVQSFWIKAVIVVVAMVLLFIPSVKVHAEESSGTCGENLTWTLTEDGTLTISGTGAMIDFEYNYIQCSGAWVKDKVKQVVIQNGVTSIGARAFYHCTNLSSVEIPDSLTSIGNDAFYDCSSLSSITIPNSVTSIGNSAFSGCSLSSITIPNSVTSIGDGAFSGCSLSSITIPNSVTSIGSYAFSGCSFSSITIPNSVTSIGNAAFNCCESLSSITIPSSVTSISGKAFYGCKSLSSITIPNSVISIGEHAFFGCSSLSSITIPDSVTSIDIQAFSYCSSLSSVTISNSVTSIGSAFNCCESLSSITIPSSVTSISDFAFYGCKSLSSITIPNSVTSIEENSFYLCPINDVYYDGVETQWNAISIAALGNESLINATIHFVPPVDREQVESFVSRMYTIILERDPEAEGLRDWTNQLVSRQIDGASFSNGVVMSQEYTNKNDSDESYVNKLYRTFLNREADEGGFDSWVTQLKRGYSRKSVLAGFVNSEEFTQICASYGIDRGTMTLTEQESARSDDNLHIDSEQVKAYVTRLYDKILGREPDEEGFNNWVNSITSRQQNAAVVAKIGFFESQEYANKNRTNEEFVTDCYRSLMGREPDEGGFTDWTGRLSRGEMTRAEVIETGFGQSQEFANILRQYGLKMAE